MGTLNQISKVDVTLSTSAARYAPFASLMIAGAATFDGRVRVFRDPLAAQLDFEIEAPLKAAVNRAFAQTPSPSEVKVGRVNVASKVVNTASPVVASGDVFSVTYGAEKVEVTGKTTAATVMTDLAAGITAKSTWPITATASGTDLTITWKAGKLGGVKLSSTLVTASATTNEEYDTALGAIQLIDPAFYGVAVDTRTTANVIKVADWCEARIKLFGTSSRSSDITNQSVSNDLFSQLQAKNLFRTFGVWSSKPDAYPEVAWMSKMLTMAANPVDGWPNWALKNLAVDVDIIDPTSQTTIWKKGGNTFERYTDNFQTAGEGLALTNQGKVFANEWIDVIVARDFVADRIQKDQVTMMINKDVVPYTDTGIAMHEAQLSASFRYLRDRLKIVAPDEYDENDQLIPSFTITAPRRSTISDATVASRKVQLQAKARLAGAIQLSEISVNLGYSI